MKRWIVFGFSNCKDPQREAEFVRWYTQVRHPDLMKTGLVKTARLYKNARGSGEQPAFLAVYELEAEELFPVISYLRRETVRLDRMGREASFLTSARAAFTKKSALLPVPSRAWSGRR